MKRYFEFQDSKSYKFWQFDVDSLTVTITYGKIGTTGQEKVTTFETEEKLQKDMAKLVAEKTKKGYVEKVEASSKKVSKRISVSYDEADNGKTLLEKVKLFLKGDVSDVDSIVIGSWEEPADNTPQEALDFLAENVDKLPKLRELFVGDMGEEECEISWICQADYSKILSAFTELEKLHIKGSEGLEIGKINHSKLKSLTIECGGLPCEILPDLEESKLPNLETLILYLGVADYGFDGSFDDLKPFMAKELFPKLTYLGFRNSEFSDEIAAGFAEAPILDQLEIFDLSMGTLGDEGAEALLASSKVPSLKKLDIHYHFLSNELLKKIKALPIIVDASEQQDEDDERYPAISE